MLIISVKELRDNLRADALNYIENISFLSLIKLYTLTPGFKYSFWLRIATYFSNKRLLYSFFRLILYHYSLKLGIEISPKTSIGKGLSINHFGGIVIHSKAIIGENLKIRQGVTIGFTDKGTPTIGNNVYIGAGAKVIGNVKIGDNVKIGANAVVLKDIPNNCSAVGIPARIIFNNTNENKS